MNTSDTKQIVEPLRFELTIADIAKIAREREQVSQEQEHLDANFESLKANYKFRSTEIQNRLSHLSQKIREGFEMRNTEMEVSYNDPERGFKTTRRTDNFDTVRVEKMTALDIEQRALPLEEPKHETPAPETSKGPTGAAEESASDANGVEPHPNLTADGERTGTLSQTEGGESAGVTPMGQKLAAAAAASEQPKVPLNLEKFGSDHLTALNAFKKFAKKAGWPIPAVNLIAEQCTALKDDPKVEEKVFAILAPHVTDETK